MDISPVTASQVNTAYNSHPYAIPQAGMQQAQVSAQVAGKRIAEGEITPKSVVELNTSIYSFKANAMVMKSMDEMQGTLLNVLA